MARTTLRRSGVALCAVATALALLAPAASAHKLSGESYCYGPYRVSTYADATGSRAHAAQNGPNTFYGGLAGLRAATRFRHSNTLGGWWYVDTGSVGTIHRAYGYCSQ